MPKSKREKLYILPNWKVSEDWETSLLSWPPLCWDTPYKKSSHKVGSKCNVWSSPRLTTEFSNPSRWSEVSVEYRMPKGYDSRK